MPAVSLTYSYPGRLRAEVRQAGDHYESLMRGVIGCGKVALDGGNEMPNQLVRKLLVEEIERIVADAGAQRRIVKAGRHAPYLLRAYPSCGLTADQVVTEIGAAAACAGVPVELARPESV